MLLLVLRVLRCLHGAVQISPLLTQISRGLWEPPYIYCPLVHAIIKLQKQEEAPVWRFYHCVSLTVNFYTGCPVAA